MSLLEIKQVSKVFKQGKQELKALDKVSLEVTQGECFAIVGESGSGKSTLANIMLGIYPATEGRVVFKGQTLPVKRSLEQKRAIQLVQQNPLSSLNPRRSVGASIRLALDVHHRGAAKKRWQKVDELLKEVGLSEQFRKRSPSSLSGGQLQRIAIARALACESELIVLDEPTSALDVLVQARILHLLMDIKAKENLTYVFITHDLSVVRNIADRVAVFEKGKLVELSNTQSLFENPKETYTRKLLSAIPVVDKEEAKLRDAYVEGV